MTDEQIIKALEHCASDPEGVTCESCPFNEMEVCDRDHYGLEKYTLSLIKSQKAEIEKWKKAQERTKGTLEIVLKNKDDRTIELEKAIKESIEFVKEQGELIEQLKAENDIHVKERAKDIFKFTELASEINLLKMEKSKAVKEFAERLKSTMFNEDFLLCEPCDMANIIDNLVKEMTEDEGK